MKKLKYAVFLVLGIFVFCCGAFGQDLGPEDDNSLQEDLSAAPEAGSGEYMTSSGEIEEGLGGGEYMTSDGEIREGMGGGEYMTSDGEVRDEL